MTTGTSSQRDVIRAAAKWYALLRSDDVTAQQQAEHQSWLQAHPAHQQTWQQLDKFRQQLQGVPGSPALDALNIKLRQGQSRRTVLRGLTFLATGSALGALTWQQAPVEQWVASHKTARGERREFVLADGTQLFLNTATALDLVETPGFRMLRLYDGEIYIRTAKAATALPLQVHTEHGLVTPLGTVFTVRSQAEATQVTVLEDRVELIPAAGIAQLVRAGQTAELTARRVQIEDNALPADAWTRGLLVVTDWPLSELVAELGRYRPGILRCAPEIAGLRVSGSFPIDNTDRALQAVANALPVKVARRTDYWITLQPAG